jgi:hypothetical protein
MTQLPAPIAPLAARFGDAPELQGLISPIVNASDWPDRIAALDRVLTDGAAAAMAKGDAPEVILSTVYVGVTTGLELLAERTIDGPEAAFVYAISAHRGWRDAARECISPPEFDGLLVAWPVIGAIVRIAIKMDANADTRLTRH